MECRSQQFPADSKARGLGMQSLLGLEDLNIEVTAAGWKGHGVDEYHQLMIEQGLFQ